MDERRTPQSQETAVHARRKPRRRADGAARGVFMTLLTLILIGCCATAMLFGIFMKYVNTSLLPTLDVKAEDYTMAQSSVVYYQDKDSGQWRELYGRKAELTLGLDLYAPPSAGEAGLQAAFDKLMEALAGGGPGGLILREVSCGETGYDTAGRLLKRSVQAVYDTYLYAVAQPGGAFLDFEIRGEET